MYNYSFNLVFALRIIQMIKFIEFFFLLETSKNIFYITVRPFHILYIYTLDFKSNFDYILNLNISMSSV